MDKNEYDKIINLNYEEYCTYLKSKYGPATENYMDKNFKRNPKCSRTNEGLFVHHIYEDRAIMLSNTNYASEQPYYYQKAENLVYCDYLEHMLLHILICEQQSFKLDQNIAVGIGGITEFMIPKLNDYYSGWKSEFDWENNCLNKIKNEKETYFELIKRLNTNCSNYLEYETSMLFSSFNARFGTWEETKNNKIYKQIETMLFENVHRL